MDKKELLHQMKEILDGERLPPGLDGGYTFTDWTALYSSQEEKHYDFKAPKGFTERWGIGRGRTQYMHETEPTRKVLLNNSPLRTAERATAGVKELVLCEKCGVYIDHLEHWCGGMALACRGRYTYQGWRHYWKNIFWVWRYSTPLPLRRFP